MTATKLNPIQLHLLQLFAHNMSEQELVDIKQLLGDYFVRKADEEMVRLQQQQPKTQADLDVLLNSPYVLADRLSGRLIGKPM